MLPCNLSSDFFYRFPFFSSTLSAFFPLQQWLIFSSFGVDLLLPVCSPKPGGKLSPKLVMLQRWYHLWSAGCIPKLTTWANPIQQLTKTKGLGWEVGVRNHIWDRASGSFSQCHSVFNHSVFYFIPKSKALAGIQFINQILVNTDLNFPHDKVR